MIIGLFSRLTLVTHQTAGTQEFAGEVPGVCPIPAPAPSQIGSNLLQHSKSHLAEGVHAESLVSIENHGAAEIGTFQSAVAQGNSSGLGGPGGESIFMVNIQDIDDQVFHITFAGMIAFTILVDRIQNFVGRHARTSVLEERLLSRVNAELNMFGCVGLSIFVLTNLFKSIPARYVLYITYADICASFAACNMILVTVMLYLMKSLALPYLASLETSNREQRKTIDIVQKTRSGLFENLGQAEYEIMSTTFAKFHTLPETVMYVNYLSECLLLNACDIMDLKWTSWMVILVFSILAVIFRWLRVLYGGSAPFFLYVSVYAVVNWVFFWCSVIIFSSVNAAYKHMFEYLKSIDRQEEAEYKSPMSDNMPEQIKFGMQVTTLLNSFSLAVFLMTWIFNLRMEHVHWSVYFFMLMPYLMSTVVVLPFTIFRFTIVHAFYNPNQDALDSLFEQYDRLEDDLNYLGRLYQRKGRPALPDLQRGCDEETLARIVRNLGLHITDRRMHR